MGGLLREAATDRGLQGHLIDVATAYNANPLTRRINFWIRGRLPSRLQPFSEEVLVFCRQEKPDVLISTGIAPLHAEALSAIRQLGTKICNFLTDDPWNPAHRPPSSRGRRTNM